MSENYKTAKDALKCGFKLVDRLYESSGNYFELHAPSGFKSIDAAIGGYYKGDLIVVLSEPNSANAFFLNSIINVAKANHPVVFLSLKNGIAEVALQIISSQSGLPLNLLVRGIIPIQGFFMVTAAVGRLIDAPFLVKDRIRITIDSLIGEVRTAKRLLPSLSLIFIDSFTLFSNQEIGELLRRLKICAVELHMAVVTSSITGDKVVEMAEKYADTVFQLSSSKPYKKDVITYQVEDFEEGHFRYKTRQYLYLALTRNCPSRNIA